MVASWPSSLPDYPLRESFQENLPNRILRTENSEGPAKTRPKTTSGVTTFRIRLDVDKSQRATFVDFFENTLEGGAKEFEWVHPVTRDTHNFRIIPEDQGSPVIRPKGAGFKITIKMELIP